MRLKIEDISKLKKDEKDYFFKRVAKLKADRYLLQSHIVEHALRDLEKYMEGKNENNRNK